MEGGGNEFTGEITLRPLELSDIDDFMAWASDEKVTRFCTWEPAICLNGHTIGDISVTKNSGNDKCRGELGYVLGSKYWGRGIATKVVKQVANTIFAEWPHLERLEAIVDVENLGSQRVLEKAGFQREGVLRKYMLLKGKTRDMVMFSRLSSDPKS
ncbi:putative n-acetyltransferase p20 [Quercus suber]|uniref:N-acetyltransferase p20 n=1 Tax=Quercus suber TaxID=58331 RepID=A0AAW0JFJ1_QUESU|nr:putative n-acetyltransferase p20 [Quercus suber]